jgi:hypothetical protein
MIAPAGPAAERALGSPETTNLAVAAAGDWTPLFAG